MANSIEIESLISSKRYTLGSKVYQLAENRNCECGKPAVALIAGLSQDETRVNLSWICHAPKASVCWYCAACLRKNIPCTFPGLLVRLPSWRGDDWETLFAPPCQLDEAQFRARPELWQFAAAFAAWSDWMDAQSSPGSPA